MSSRKLRAIKKIIQRTDLSKDLVPFALNLVKNIAGNYRKDASRDIPHPVTISLELTNKCNLHCVMCPREHDFGKQMDVGNMTTELAKKLIDESVVYLQSMGLTGLGETLFARNLVEVAAYAKKRKKSLAIFISSNANMPDFIERLTPVLPYIDTLQISTDGVGEGYEEIRKNGSFALLDKNLHAAVPLAREHGVDIMFNMVINKRNFRQMADVIDYAGQLGVKFVNFNYINLASVTALPVEYYDFFTTAGFRQELDRAKATAAKRKEIEVTGLDFPGNPGISKCPLIWGDFQINFDGEVPPCCAKPFSKEYSFGNASEKPLMEVLNSARAKAFRGSAIRGIAPDFCAKCHFVKL